MRVPTLRAIRAAAALAIAAGVAQGCDKGGGKGPPAATSGAASERAPAGSADVIPASTTAAAGVPSGAASAAAAPAVDFGPKASKVELGAIGPECKSARNEIGTYLQRGELDIAGREGAVAAAYLIQLPNRPAAQVAFGGFDAEAKQIAPKRGIGSSRDHAPRVFATGTDWTVAWFDQEGLAHARPKWEAQPAPEVSHLAAVGSDVSADVALAETPSGALVVSAPFGTDKSQLSLFLFAPVEADAPAVKAIGVTKRARRPTRPAVAADASGYFLAWHDEGGAIVATRFDAAGKEGDAVSTIAPPASIRRDDLVLLPTQSGALAVWLEGGAVHSRALDRAARPTGPAYDLGSGRWLAAAAEGPVAIAAWVGKAGEKDDQLVAVRLNDDGSPAGKGLVVSNEPVKDRPAVAVAGPRAAFAWTEQMSPAVATKRANLRMIDADCMK